jgi:hypothetical protein
MFTLATFKALAFGASVAAAAFTSTAAPAEECYAATGNCSAGYQFRPGGVEVTNPFSGTRVRLGDRCCKICGTAQYGTPGCPYPSFGKQYKAPASSGPCGRGWHKGADGECYMN